MHNIWWNEIESVGRMDILELKHIYYQVEDKKILSDISLKVRQGSRLTITGHSGSGKSTILKLIADLISPSSGEIFFKNQNINELDPVEYRRHVSYCFQQPSLFGETVKDNLHFPYELRKQAPSEDEITEFLWKVDLDKSYLDKKITTLSGGEKQRVALIRNLIFKPEVLLLDEVTTGLDEQSKSIVHQLISDYHKAGTTILEVTHDPAEIDLASQIIEIKKGSRVK